MPFRKARMARVAAAGAAVAITLGMPGVAAADVPSPNIGHDITKASVRQDIRAIGGRTSFDITTHDVVNHQINAGSGHGYWQVALDGGVFAFGDAEFAGSAAGITDSPIVGMAKTPDGKGYWLAASNGAVFAFGNAQFSGSAHDLNLNAPIVGIATAPVGNNDSYYLVAADGGVFAFGDAEFHGSAVDLHHDWMSNPILGIRSNADGSGYWETAIDGGIFAYGGATFHGAAHTYNPEWGIIGMDSKPGSDGYVQVGFDAGVFAFGDNLFYGSGAGNDTSVAFGIAETKSGAGYWTFWLDGSVETYGNAVDYSTSAAVDFNEPVIGMVVSGDDT